MSGHTTGRHARTKTSHGGTGTNLSEPEVADLPIVRPFTRARRSTGTARSAWRRTERRHASTPIHAGRSLRPGTTVSLADSCLLWGQNLLREDHQRAHLPVDMPVRLSDGFIQPAPEGTGANCTSAFRQEDTMHIPCQTHARAAGKFPKVSKAHEKQGFSCFLLASMPAGPPADVRPRWSDSLQRAGR